MNSPDLVLAVDNGTQSLKALLFSAVDGSLVATQNVPFTPPYESPQPGWAEQDPAIYWNALCRACHGLWENGTVDRHRIAGVALTTQRGTVIPVDRNGTALRPAILWLDQRKTYGLRPITGPWGLLFRILNLSDTIAYFQAEAEANWIRTYQPDIWKKTHKYLFLSGYLSYRLTGDYVDSVGCQVGYIPFDFRRLQWARRYNWKWQVLPMDPARLSTLIPPTQALGEISTSASRETGIPAGLPLIAAAADKACEVIGSGSLDTATGCLSYGTTATINVTSKKYVEAIPLLPPYPSAVPGYHTLEVQIYRGFWMVSWFMKEFCHWEKIEAESNGMAVEDILDNLIDEVPAGSLGLVLQPYWSPGLKLPGPEAKGAVIGFGDIHGRGHFYRAILEGIGYALREGKERIETRTKTPLTNLRVSGGGSQSRNAMQMTADIFGLPTARPHVYETSGLGAAIDAAVGLGLHDDFNAAVMAMTHTGDVFEPNLKNHELYNALYRDVYKKMYPRLKPLYRRIRDITGYPR